MLERIQQLEAIAKQLEPDSSARKELRDEVIEYTESFLENIYENKAFVITEDNGKNLYDSPITEEPTAIDTLLSIFRENVETPGLNPASRGHLAYIPGGGLYPSSLGDYIAAITNRYAGIFFPSPGAVRMENMMIRWLCHLIGYPDTAFGNLTSGGSIANLIGIVCARDAHQLRSKDFDKCVIYLTEQIHHSVNKSIIIAGLGEAVIRHLPMDEYYRMNTTELENTIRNDKKAGLRPWMVISSAGTTDTGAVDPISDISEITTQNGMWHHVDAAYGGFFILCDEGKKILKGLDTSDSITLDPHKGLFLPYGSGAILVKDKQHLYNSHRYTAPYMQDALQVEDEPSPADLSPELTKHFRGLRMWLPLKLFGVKPFRAGVEEKMLLARYFRNELQKIKGFEVGPEPDLSVVIYRFVPKNGNANQFNEKLIQEIHEDGRVFLSSTKINGVFYLRLAVMVFRTHKDTIDLALKVLNEKVVILNDQKEIIRHE